MMAPLDSPRFVWIKTQDGSPTLWNNELGEPFRSVKGAFQESLIVFVKPAIEFAQSLLSSEKKNIVVGEFGLGAGTNWVFFSLLAKHFQIPFRYFAIERDTESFRMAFEKWKEEEAFLKSVILQHTGIEISSHVGTLTPPMVFPSLNEAVLGFDSMNVEADIWFHDPFGFGVNPEGYSSETLQVCRGLWAPVFKGYSYACNSAFQKKLRELGLEACSRELDAKPLKKESLVFGNL